MLINSLQAHVLVVIGKGKNSPSYPLPTQDSRVYRLAHQLTINLKDDEDNQKRERCSKFAPGLLFCSHRAHIRMRSNRLLRLDDNKFAGMTSLLQVVNRLDAS